MKTKIIEGLEKRLLLIDGLPEDAKNFRMRNGNMHYDCLIAPNPFNIPPGNWQYLCRIKEVEPMHLHKILHVNRNFGFNMYYNYLLKDYTFFHKRDSAKESFLSALEAEGITSEHPDGEMPKPIEFGYFEDYDAEGHLNSCGWNPEDGEDEYHNAVDVWLLDNRKVFKPENTLIFIEQ